MTLVDRAIRRAKRAAGYETRDVINPLAGRDPRWTTFCRAVEYVDYEAVPGDIVEFGVFTGISLALLAKAHSFDPKGNGTSRRRVRFVPGVFRVPTSRMRDGSPAIVRQTTRGIRC